jgi:branched-chain amino acid transport system substrate-binding protein
VIVCSYPPHSVGMVRTVNELGSQIESDRGQGRLQRPAQAQLSPLLNGFINYEFWIPVPKVQFRGVADLISRYQTRGAAERVDPPGFLGSLGVCSASGTATSRGGD